MDRFEERIDSRLDELRNLIITQNRRPSQESINNPPLGTIPHVDVVVQPPPVETPEITPAAQHYSTRLSKVDFPRFDGKKVKDWLYKCEQFFMLDETPPECRVRLASIHLEWLALQWHLNYMRGRFDQYPQWSQYAVDVRRRFGDLYEDPLADLIQVKHSTSAQNYIDEFELAQTQVSILPEYSIFIAGLNPTTQAHVRMFNPTSIAQAANIAKLCEAVRPNQATYEQPFPPPKSQTQATKNNQTPILTSIAQAANIAKLILLSI